jgi:hypothetical protein
MNRGRVVVAVTWLLFGVGISVAMGRAYFAQKRAATAFAPTRATILSSTLSGPPRTSQKDTSYTLKVRYQYAGGNSLETATTFNYLGVSYGTLREANAALQRYPEGAQVTAYYDPKDPSRSVLDRTSPRLGWPMFIMAIFMAIGVYLLQSGLRGENRSALSI